MQVSKITGETPDVRSDKRKPSINQHQLASININLQRTTERDRDKFNGTNAQNLKSNVY